MLMETKTVSRCIHNGFNAEETNSNSPIDPVIPVPPLYSCCFIITQSFYNTDDLIHVVHKCHN